jgi:hypothetical protein
MKIFVSLGISCTVASAIRNIGVRKAAYPFDWVVTYGGITNILKNFEDYLPKDTQDICKLSNVFFAHNKFPDDLETMNRRIKRFNDLLNNNFDEIVFIRESHRSLHHHTSIEAGLELKNDILDCEELCEYLKTYYPNLKFQILLFLICNKCFETNFSYISKYKELKIQNYVHMNNDICRDGGVIEHVYMNTIQRINNESYKE